MVRAAFKGDGAQFLVSCASDRVSTQCRMARTAKDMEIAINRLTKLRFPQGSEVWISGCPKFGAAGKSGLTNPVTAKTVQPGRPPWRAASAFPRS
jgi:hypothetical protein